MLEIAIALTVLSVVIALYQIWGRLSAIARALEKIAKNDGRAIRIIPREGKDYKIVLPGGIEAYDPERR